MRIRKSVRASEVVQLLNELLKIDKNSIENLFNIRVFCNQKLAKHATVQVGQIAKHTYSVGFIGILNGLFGIDKNGWGCIAINLNDGRIESFKLLKPNTKGKESLV